jgi:hypothetical protein
LNKQYNSYFLKKVDKKRIIQETPLKKVMPYELWKEYKELKCDADLRFGVVVQSYCNKKYENTDLGLFAGSNSAYEKFSKVYYPFIEQIYEIGYDHDNKESL